MCLRCRILSLLTDPGSNTSPRAVISQGDPLSPNLFICCVEAFIQMVEMAMRQRRLTGTRVAPTAPLISNLCFADDTILFTQATAQEVEVVREVLEKYAAALGQIIHMQKSTMVFIPNIQTVEADAIQQILPFQVVEKFDRYLRLPARVGRSRVESFSYLKDKLWARVQKWNGKSLSMAGREVMIKSVLQAIPTYVMSCFKLPESILDGVEKIVRRFRWGSKQSKGISWISWAKLCGAKVDGGMGFRDMAGFNLALLTKQVWRISTWPDLLLSRVLKARYLFDASFACAELGDRSSLTWRSILLARPHLEPGLRRKIGNGKTLGPYRKARGSYLPQDPSLLLSQTRLATWLIGRRDRGQWSTCSNTCGRVIYLGSFKSR